MITVKMEEDKVVELLINRVRHWTNDKYDIELYKKMYESALECTEEIVLDVNLFVDNDWCNSCTTISQDYEYFNEILELYEGGERDISVGNYGYSFVEAVSDDKTKILVRC